MPTAVETLPVSVVIPTAGRPGPLRGCLESLASCAPRAEEVLVVDQSHSAAVAELVAGFAGAGIRLVPCHGRGVAKGRNDGLRSAAHDVVLVTDDDCTVEPDWVATAWRLAAEDPERIVTGRVLAVGDRRAVPEAQEETEPRDYTGFPRTGVLFPNNMVVNRALVLAEGGFDERFGPEEAAEDNDFCYRWLKAGRRLAFEPALVVHHHDWRTPEQLIQVYTRYARGEGFLYAKHLRGGDVAVLRFLARDVLWWLRALVSAVLKRRPRWTDPRRALPSGLPRGFVDGWRTFGRDG